MTGYSTSAADTRCIAAVFGWWPLPLSVQVPLLELRQQRICSRGGNTRHPKAAMNGNLMDEPNPGNMPRLPQVICISRGYVGTKLVLKFASKRLCRTFGAAWEWRPGGVGVNRCRFVGTSGCAVRAAALERLLWAQKRDGVIRGFYAGLHFH